VKQIIAKLLTTSTIFLAGFLGLSPVLAGAIDCATCSGQSDLNSSQAIECGSSCASGSNQTTGQAENNINNTIKNLINLLSVVVGIVAVIMIILAGFRYITSGGKQESVASAKNALLYAIIGLVIVALAQIIVRFVLTDVTHPASGSSTTSTSGSSSSGGLSGQSAPSSNSGGLTGQSFPSQ
jgi:hypothetical protein